MQSGISGLSGRVGSLGLSGFWGSPGVVGLSGVLGSALQALAAHPKGHGFVETVPVLVSQTLRI